jgi:hypothetical protein
VLVDKRGAYAVVAHTNHQVLGRHTRLGRPDVPDVSEIMKMQARQSHVIDDFCLFRPLIEVRATQRPTILTGEHQSLTGRLRERVQVLNKLRSDSYWHDHGETVGSDAYIGQ